ncbi:phenylalanine--tRNA ligase subunit beta [Accumulibacter sp.]|uniref:phenylalanine--tRNA ligase subunit beta n=1 Tax=Accumulibacter sp. TaxID=2053492 RepID=UPI0025F8FB0A|nr:phenylalanine--tRNA ligase subunit beta [Accumulibacter sp.]MCM8594861.1 phenylalanine--tRNA ligase subunit beta [Accumulibacter sp.]MCM8626009.1 phenylalanine--tRNA ligase subunit beta [Accumulibacter sp.]MDS4049007.1 phenylalanine--tRNA ligase subunit beta [Accumulibacter sp.]
MKFSETWLRSFVDPACSGHEFSHMLTMAGLEVEHEESVAPFFDKVVVAEIVAVEAHPDADRLRVCRVDVGTGEPLQIVCGAPNAAAGLRVPCALAGAELPGGLAIRVARVRGVESSGMLCSARELGIAEDASGLLVLADDAPVGEDIRRHLDLDDRLRLLKLTPNRADCLSLEGIAREVSALTGIPARFVEVREVEPSISSKRPVVLDAPQACPRYCGRVIAGVDARAPTPAWLRRRLERSGIRPISALVDVSNYVMLELGQPLHVFDNQRLGGAIHARMARPGETILLLNEQTLELDEDVLLIADDLHPVAMAGIMGGEDSGVTLATTEVFVESAFFTPAAVAGRARRYGFVSDASHRFERGVDFAGTRRALERATRLILEICGGQAGPVTDALAKLPERRPVRLRPERVARVLGVELDAGRIGELFGRLALPFSRDGDDFVVSPPSYRFDIEIEEDLIEEIARLHGYENIPAPAPRALLAMLPQSEHSRPLTCVRQTLADAGYQEVVNYAFVEEAWESDFAGNTRLIRLANPIASQLAVMRSSLIGGLVANLAANLKRRQSRVRLFETGRCFFRDAAGSPVPGFRQPWKLTALAYGPALPEQWATPPRNVDFFDIKGDLELLLAPLAARFEKGTHPALHPGRSARVLLDGEPVGIVGELHPQWQQKYELPLVPVVFEIDLDALTRARLPQYAELSKQPVVIRDLAVVVDQGLELGALLEGLEQHRPPIVREVTLFDVYAGRGVEAGRKSLAFRILMQDTQKTLLEAEVEVAIQQLVAYLKEAFAAELRV